MREIIVFCSENLRRAAWVALLNGQPGFSAVHAIGTLPEFQDFPSPEKPTTLFADISDIDVITVAQLATAVPDAGLLLLIDDYDTEEAVSYLQAGATGLLSRQASVPELVQAIIAAGRGEIVLPPEMASKVMLALARGNVHQPRKIESLTDREQEVLSLLARGLTNKDIAQSLFLSVRTIEAHLRNIYSKLDIGSRTEAVLWAVQHGYES